MMRVAVKVVLLVWVAGAKTDEEEGPEDARNDIFLPEASSSDEFQRLLRQQKRLPGASELAFETNIPNPAPTESDSSRRLQEDTALIFEKMEACRESHPTMSNRTFNFQLYGSLLGELLGVKSEAFEDALRHCNITEQLVDKLKAKLSRLEIFQGIFVLIPRNNSSEPPDYEKTTQQPLPTASDAPPHRPPPSTPPENNLKLKLGDEWIPLQPKVSHLSHIYLGSSIYPILTEESRVLEVEYTAPGPASTEAPPAWTKGLAPTEPDLQEKGPDVTRLPRSLQKSPKYLEDGKGATETLGPADAPHRLNLLPRNSYRWKSSQKAALNLKKDNENPHYQVLYKLCSAILEQFKDFLKSEVLRKKYKTND